MEPYERLSRERAYKLANAAEAQAQAVYSSGASLSEGQAVYDSASTEMCLNERMDEVLKSLNGITAVAAQIGHRLGTRRDDPKAACEPVYSDDLCSKVAEVEYRLRLLDSILGDIARIV